MLKFVEFGWLFCLNLAQSDTLDHWSLLDKNDYQQDLTAQSNQYLCAKGTCYREMSKLEKEIASD